MKYLKKKKHPLPKKKNPPKKQTSLRKIISKAIFDLFQAFCLSMNSNLVEIGSESENAFVEGELKIIHGHGL